VKNAQRLHGIWCSLFSRAIPSCTAKQAAKKNPTNTTQIKIGQSGIAGKQVISRQEVLGIITSQKNNYSLVFMKR
jgi:hypothetical protein